MNQEPSPPLPGPSEAPDFKQIRRYLRTIKQRDALGRFIKAGWTPAELAEYARQMYLVPGQTKPTAVSYQFVVEKGSEHSLAQEILAGLRAPGYVIPPFDRPVPKRFEWDDPDNPDHTPALKAEVDKVARLFRGRFASQHGRPLPDPNEPIPRALWKRSYRIRNCYHSLEDTIEIQGLRADTDELLTPSEQTSP
jgi:hypothetical protein